MNKKVFIFGMLVSFFIISMFFLGNSCLKKDIIYVKDFSFYDKLMNENKEKINKIKNEKCKNSLNDLITYIDSTHFKKNVTVEEYYKAYYENDINIITYFNFSFEECNINDKKYDQIYLKALTATNYPNEVKARYLNRYTLKLEDRSEMKEIYKNNDMVGTYTTKYLELEVLSDLVEGVKK